MNSWTSTLKNTLGRGIFPHQLSFVLELPVRKLLLSPRKLVTRLHLTNATRVLEIGPGSGFYSAEIGRNVSKGRLELLDVQTEMLKKARRKCEAEGLFNAGYTQADASNLPFKERCFDVILLVTVLGEIADQKAFLIEANRILKPEGIISISEHYPDPDFSPLAQIKLLVEKEGFELSEQFGGRWSYTVNFRKLTRRFTMSDAHR
jgi:ubiquinone/menaquinone biosynthesis C-methylase UbiE